MVSSFSIRTGFGEGLPAGTINANPSPDMDKGRPDKGAFEFRGAAEGTRTPDPIITNDVLYQLSYCGTVAGI